MYPEIHYPSIEASAFSLISEKDTRTYDVQIAYDIHLVTHAEPSAHRSSNLKVINSISEAMLGSVFPMEKELLVVDCLTDYSIQEGRDELKNNNGEIAGYTFQFGEAKILNIDHHAPTEVMRDRISSFHLALRYADNPRTEMPVLITHTDADSILTSLFLQGKIAEEHIDECRWAVEATDHTGAQTDLGDLISAVLIKNDLALSVGLVEHYFKQKTEDPGFEFSTFLNSLDIAIRDNGDTFTIRELVDRYREERYELPRLFVSPEANVLPEGKPYIDIAPHGEKIIVKNWRSLERAVNKSHNRHTHDTGETAEFGIPLVTSTFRGNTFVLRYMGEGVFLIDGEQNSPNAFINSELLPKAIPPGLSDHATVVLFSRYMPDESNPHEKKETAGMYTYEVKVRAMPEIALDIPQMSFQLLPGVSATYERDQLLSFAKLGARATTGSTYRDGGTWMNGRRFGRMFVRSYKQWKKSSALPSK